MSSATTPPFDDDGAAVFDGFRPRRNPYDLNNRVMLTAAVSLSIVILLVIALHIYARYILRRQARRRAVLRRVGILAFFDSGDSPPPQRSGLDPLVMASLPVVVYKHQSGNSDFAGAGDCAVCLSAAVDGEEFRILPNCKHGFHLECIDKWFGGNSTCPICRTEAAPVILPEPREAPASASASATAARGDVSTSRLSSFRRILSRERSSRRIQYCNPQNRNDDVQDLERQ